LPSGNSNLINCVGYENLIKKEINWMKDIKKKYQSLLCDEAFLVQIVEMHEENGSMGEAVHVTYDKEVISKERMRIKQLFEGET
jgi:hypothetical protein